MLEWRNTGEPMHVRICTFLRLVAAATIRERRLILAQVRVLFESGVYSRAASIRSHIIRYAYAISIC